MSNVKELIREVITTGNGEESQIILFNDHVNSFDWVIKSLIDVLGHEPEQAEQCAMIAHHKGRIVVKSGYKRYLKPKAEALEDRGLTVELD